VCVYSKNIMRLEGKNPLAYFYRKRIYEYKLDLQAQRLEPRRASTMGGATCMLVYAIE
jgi:hypothetical protein